MGLLLRQTFAPLLSLFIFSLSSGLFSTLLVLRLHVAGSSSFVIGLMTTAYYIGLIVGAIRIEPLIIKIGHIRAFSAFASTLAVVCILQGIFIVPSLWVVFRFIAGIATVGLFIVIESWLLIKSELNIRGRTLALYMISFYASQALGQLLIKVGDINTLLPFSIAAMLSSLSVIPLAISPVSHPVFERSSRLSLRELYRVCASGVFGCLISGLIIGALYGLLPLYVSQTTKSITDVALIMLVVILGGMSLQYPVGRSSDVIDRRLVLIFITVFSFFISLLIPFLFKGFVLAIILVFFFGGLVFTIYPVSVSYACDALKPEDMVAGSQGLLFIYSIGAAAGPAVAPLFMHFLAPKGLFIYFAVVSLIATVFFLWRRSSVSAVPHEEQFIAVPHTTPVIAELDPREEAENS